MQSVHLESHAITSAVIGKTDEDFFDDETTHRYRVHDEEVLKTGKEVVQEETVTLPNGEQLIQLSLKRPLRNSKGDIIGVIGNTVDITHLKKVEADLRLAKEKAERADKAKLEFIRNMEHDIRTPFNGIWMLAELLAEAETDSEKKESLEMIAGAGKELLDLCEGILDFARMQTGALPVLEQKFNFAEMIEKISKIEMPALKNKALAFNLHYDPSIPKWLVGDTHRLSRILINLLSNAIKFTHQGQITLTARLAKLDDEKNNAIIHFSIEDTGIGMSAEHQAFIYEKFTRLTPSNTGHYKGLGLGLCAVKQFMTELSGEIEVTSEAGKGTIFTCTIPLKLPLVA